MEKVDQLLNTIKSSIQPIEKELPFDYKNGKYKGQLPEFLKIGNLIGLYENNYPALLPIENFRGLAFELNETNREEVNFAIQDLVLQMIENSNDGLVEVSVVDVVKMGANFNIIRNLNKEILSDYIANELQLNNFIEKQYEKSISIISDVLSNYSSLYEYNNLSGDTIPFRIMVIGDLPNFDHFEKFQTLIRNGKEAGIFFLISYTNNPDLSNSKSKIFEDILEKFITLSEYGNPANDFYAKSFISPKYLDRIFQNNYLEEQILKLIYDEKIEEAYIYILNNIDEYEGNSLLSIKKQEVSNELIKKSNIEKIIDKYISELDKIVDEVLNKYALINKHYKLQLDRKVIIPERLNSRVKLMTDKNQLLEEDYTKGIKIPIGKSAGKTFYFTFGFNSDNYHAIIGGQSGKGKTVLLNNIIARGIEKYDENELKFAIIDCSGTGFYEFENSKNIEFLIRSTDVNECQVGVEKLEQELNRRQELFREYGVSDIEEYVKKSNKSLPRLITVIDEFHVLYTGSYKQSEYFDKVLVDKIIRIGRKFGMHLIVSTQSLGGGVRRSILDNIPLRIALGMTKEQSNSFLSMKNDAAANLERGIAIYNNMNGSVLANKKVKINYIDEKDIKRILSLKQ